MNTSLEEQLRSDLQRVGAQVGQPIPDHLGFLAAELDRRRRKTIRTRIVGSVAAAGLALAGSVFGGRAVFSSKGDDGQTVSVAADSATAALLPSGLGSFFLPLTLPNDLVIDRTITGVTIAGATADSTLAVGGEASIWNAAVLSSDTAHGWIASNDQRDPTSAEAPTDGTVESVHVFGTTGTRQVNGGEVRIRFVRSGQRVEAAFVGVSPADALRAVDEMYQATEDDWRRYDDSNQQTDTDPAPDQNIYIGPDPVRPPLVPAWLPDGLEFNQARDQFPPDIVFSMIVQRVKAFGTEAEWVALIEGHSLIGGFVPGPFGEDRALNGGFARLSADGRAASWDRDRGHSSLLVLSSKRRTEGQLMNLLSKAQSDRTGGNQPQSLGGMDQIFDWYQHGPTQSFELMANDRLVPNNRGASCSTSMTKLDPAPESLDPKNWLGRIHDAFSDSSATVTGTGPNWVEGVKTRNVDGYRAAVWCQSARVASAASPDAVSSSSMGSVAQRVLDSLQPTTDASWEKVRAQIMNRFPVASVPPTSPVSSIGVPTIVPTTVPATDAPAVTTTEAPTSRMPRLTFGWLPADISQVTPRESRPAINAQLQTAIFGDASDRVWISVNAPGRDGDPSSSKVVSGVSVIVDPGGHNLQLGRVTVSSSKLRTPEDMLLVAQSVRIEDGSSKFAVAPPFGLTRRSYFSADETKTGPGYQWYFKAPSQTGRFVLLTVDRVTPVGRSMRESVAGPTATTGLSQTVSVRGHMVSLDGNEVTTSVVWEEPGDFEVTVAMFGITPTEAKRIVEGIVEATDAQWVAGTPK